MTDGPGQTLRRRKLGKELKRHRDEADMTIREVADAAGFKQGTISKIENAKQAILPRTVKLILQACGVGEPTMSNLMRMAEESERRGWWVEFSDTIPNWFASYVDLESDADEIWKYESELVTGLLQTPDYSAAAFRAGGLDLTEPRLRREVELRQARQAQLDRENAANLHVVLNEAVLRRPVGGEHVMRQQLRHLVTMAERPNITVQVLSFSAGAHPGMKSPFTLLRFPEGYNEMDCVYLENENGEVWQERPADIARYTEVFDHLRRQALSPQETVAFVDMLT